MSTPDETVPADTPMPRDEIVALVARAHTGAAYGESSLAGKTLAAQSKLPRVIAENLGAGFGQWDFFPEPVEIVDFALAYVPPSTEEDLWAMARAWAADDAASRRTLMALVGRDILQHELRRIDVPKLRAVVVETNAARARELRESAGLEVRALAPAKPASKRSTNREAAPRAPRPPTPPPALDADMTMRMPKPERKPIPKPPPPPAPKRYQHPKFGEGVLQSQDGAGDEAKLTIKFESGTKTLLARYVTEIQS